MAKGVYECASEHAANGLAYERGYMFGQSAIDGRWYAGRITYLVAVGCVRDNLRVPIDPRDPRAPSGDVLRSIEQDRAIAAAPQGWESIPGGVIDGSGEFWTYEDLVNREG